MLEMKEVKDMKNFMKALLVLSMSLAAGVTIPEEELVCAYIENDEGELELVCVPANDAVQPSFYCDPDCWDDVL